MRSRLFADVLRTVIIAKRSFFGEVISIGVGRFANSSIAIRRSTMAIQAFITRSKSDNGYNSQQGKNPFHGVNLKVKLYQLNFNTHPSPFIAHCLC